MKTEIRKWENYKVKKITADNAHIYINDDLMEFLNSIDLKGKNVIDGGCNVGLYSLVFSDLVGKEGVVYAYDIQPTITDMCKGNIALNRKTNVFCYNLAVSNAGGREVGFTPINYEDENVSSVGVKTEPRGDIMVQTIAIDEQNFQNVGLIKLDIEGHEPQALEGAWETIDKWKPYLIIELSNGYLEGRVRGIIDLIISHGYTVKALSDFNYCFEPQPPA